MSAELNQMLTPEKPSVTLTTMNVTPTNKNEVLLTKDTTNLVFKCFMNHLHENFLTQYGNQSFTYDVGRKYIRVWAIGFSGGRSAYCFIDRETGDVLKTATWKAPAKNGPRGNLYDGVGNTNCYGVTQYGAYYFR